VGTGHLDVRLDGELDDRDLLHGRTEEIEGGPSDDPDCRSSFSTMGGILDPSRELSRVSPIPREGQPVPVIGGCANLVGAP
jgi:hypothetical protein